MGAILNVFAGAASFTPVLQSFTTAGTFADQAIPTGATTAVIEVFGSSGDGGAGRAGCFAIVAGGGGGSGAYCKTTFNVSALNGKTFNLAIQTRGVTAATTVSAGTTNPVTGFTTMSSPGGSTGTSAASGGGGGSSTIATGGTDVNQTGNTGGNGTCSGGAGGLGKTGTNGNGGDGGQGGVGAGNAGLTLGQAGRVYIRYT